MRKFIFPVILLFGASLLISACSSDDGDNVIDPTPDPIIRLIAEAHQDPTIDNALTDTVWDNITAVSIPTGTDASYTSDGFFTNSLTVEMKALVADDSLLYIWAKWNDNDEDNRYGQMTATWTSSFRFRTALGDTNLYNEDRFMLMFDNGGTDGADCASYCHSQADTSSTGSRFYGTGPTDADLWIWRAHRTGLANLSDNSHVTSTEITPDALSGDLYTINYDGFLGKPFSMHQDTTAYIGAGLLESQPGGFVNFDGLSLVWGTFPANQSPVGLNLPGVKIWDVSGSDGSRWEVQTKAAHDGTHWTAVFRRNLTPTDGTDRSFVGLDSVSMSIAVSDNSDKHKGRKPFYLIFQ